MKNWLKPTSNTKRAPEENEKRAPEAKQTQAHNYQKPPVVLVGADVCALYPSMDPVRTGEVVREETIRSKIIWQGMDWRECLKYLKMNLTPYQAKVRGVAHLLPVRLHNRGPAPGMSSANAKSANRNKEDKWVFWGRAAKEPSEEEKRYIMGACLEIAVKVLFNNHCYKYCEEIFKQVGGGPTGLSSSGGAANLRILNWARQVK